MERRRSKEDDEINPWRDQKTVHRIDGSEWGIELDELNKQAEKVQDPKEAVDVIKQYEDIIWRKKKGIINIALHQGNVFKWFKEKESSSP